MAGRVLELVTLGILLVSATFAVLALNFAWGTVDAEAGGQSFKIGYEPLSTRFAADGESSSSPYTSDTLDDVDGVGMVRAGGVLFLIGTIMVGVAALLAEHRLVLGREWLTMVTAVTGLVATGLLVTAAILLPIGISEVAKGSPLAQFGDDVTWSFGFYAGIVAAATALAATVISGVASMRGAGFKLQLADSGGDDFDA